MLGGQLLEGSPTANTTLGLGFLGVTATPTHSQRAGVSGPWIPPLSAGKRWVGPQGGPRSAGAPAMHALSWLASLLYFLQPCLPSIACLRTLFTHPYSLRPGHTVPITQFSGSPKYLSVPQGIGLWERMSGCTTLQPAQGPWPRGWKVRAAPGTRASDQACSLHPFPPVHSPNDIGAQIQCTSESSQTPQ